MPLSKQISALPTWVRRHPIAFLVICIVSFGTFGSALKYLDEDAQRQKALKAKERNLLAKVNPFLAPPSPTPSPQLSKEYVYAGSRLLAVDDANASAVPPADLAVWRPNNGDGYGYWYVLGGPGSATTVQGWGLPTDIPVPGDYDGDGKTDFSIYRRDDPSSDYAKWYVINSGDNSWSITEWGLERETPADIPAPADYDGDGKTDRAIFRQDDPSSGYCKWWINYSSNNYIVTVAWGIDGDKPIPHDYDGDGKADLTVWRDSNTNFYSIYSTDSSQQTLDFGSTINGDPVSADYDGDGKADFAVFKPGVSSVSYASWNIRSSSSGSMWSAIEWGIQGDKPVQNDYDGDGKCDPAIWRPSDGYWWIAQSGSSYSTRTQAWGQSGDIPVPAYFRR